MNWNYTFYWYIKVMAVDCCTYTINIMDRVQEIYMAASCYSSDGSLIPTLLNLSNKECDAYKAMA